MVRAAAAASPPPSVSHFERLARALLSATAEVGGFDVAYLTTIDWGAREQLVRFAYNVGPVAVAEGHRLALPSDLDEHVFPGVSRSYESPTPQPDSQVARKLGLATYVSVPVVTLTHALYGTLCGAGRAEFAVDDATVAAMQCFAALLSDHMVRADAESASRKRAAAEREMQDRAQFLAESEHKLKTHLAVIGGWATTLAENDHRLDPHVRTKAVEVIRSEADKLAGALQRMLEHAQAGVETQPDIGLVELEAVDVDIADLVRSSVQMLAGAAPYHTVACTGTASMRAAADPAVLHQVLAHLIDNAVKYSPRGSTVTVSVAMSGRWAMVEVIDQGIGVPAGVDVFSAFVRSGDDEVQATHGVGLGLHIVRSLVQSMGGVVSARRNDGGGSTFTVLLPATASSSSSAAEPPPTV